MLTPGDGIAVASVCGVIIAGFLRAKMGGDKPSNGSSPVTRRECDNRFEMLVKMMEGMQQKLNEIDNFIRGVK